MKKRYQIDREQAVRRFHKQAEKSEQELQLHLPLKQVAAALQDGVGQLMRQAGLEWMQLIMDQEVHDLAGERYQRRETQQPFRWGHEKGFLVVDGQKVPIQRPQLRSEKGRARWRARIVAREQNFDLYSWREHSQTEATDAKKSGHSSNSFYPVGFGSAKDPSCVHDSSHW